MTLIDYVLNGPSTVIAEDDRDPYVSWQHHLERTDGLRGGVDLVAAVGTPILAPTAGTMAHVPNDGSAGNSCRFYHDMNAGWKDVFSHISRYVGLSGQHFDQGEIIAYSGDSGGVAPHVHRHLLDPQNIRRNPWDYFTASSTAGGGSTPIAPEEDDVPILELIQTPDGTVWYCVNRLHRYGIPGQQYLGTYQSFIDRNGAPGSSSSIKQQANGNAFGSPVYSDGVPVTDR